MNLAIVQPAIKKAPRKPSEHSLVYGDEIIRFTREERTSGVQRVLIQVHPDCSVIVQAPSSASQEDVIAAVKKTSALDL
jgi:hypothetical protein